VRGSFRVVLCEIAKELLEVVVVALKSTSPDEPKTTPWGPRQESYVLVMELAGTNWDCPPNVPGGKTMELSEVTS
jgi:hypothetical protein